MIQKFSYTEVVEQVELVKMVDMSLIKPEESRKLKQIKLSTKIEIVEKKFQRVKKSSKLKVKVFSKNCLQNTKELFTFDDISWFICIL